jgi:hypothetical protein
MSSQSRSATLASHSVMSSLFAGITSPRAAKAGASVLDQPAF